MHKNYSNIMDMITSSVWLITPDSLQNILSIMDRKMQGEELSEEQLLDFGRQQAAIEEEQGPGVGVLNISGPIFPKANMMTQMSGATSIQQLQSDLRSMLANDQVTSIMLNIDSPGGVSDLIMELGDEIFAARGIKPIAAVANTTAASAAYWLGSQAEKFYVTPSGMVGSVGVYTVHQDQSGKQEKEGINTTLISAGKYKVEGNPFGPLSDDAKSHMQDRVNETYGEFVSAVARGRGTTEDVVKEAYGDGRTYRAKTAHAMGMVDGIATYDEVVGNMLEGNNAFNGMVPLMTTTTGSHTSYTYTPVTETKEDKVEGFSPETLEALGLSEDSSVEEIEEAVMSMAVEVSPLREAAASQAAFADQFPEQAAQLAELRERDIATSAQLFADSYAQFPSGKGFSSVALEQITETHKKISMGDFSHDDLKGFLSLISEGSAVVDYAEHGTSREAEQILAANGKEAAQSIAMLARQAQADAGGPSKLSWGDAVAQVAAEHPELAAQYRGGE